MYGRCWDGGLRWDGWRHGASGASLRPSPRRDSRVGLEERSTLGPTPRVFLAGCGGEKRKQGRGGA